MTIETDRKGRTLVLRMNRPDALNALDVESMIDLNAALREFRDDPADFLRARPQIVLIPGVFVAFVALWEWVVRQWNPSLGPDAAVPLS